MIYPTDMSQPIVKMVRPDQESTPMSRTHQYRKVMKPLLERKRRARINKYLDDLKDLMVSALASEGESITKLEKADVLELTVKHLHKLKRENALGLTPEAAYAGRFKAGYARCAKDVSDFMTGQIQRGIEPHTSTRLLSHLGGCLQALDRMSPSALCSVPAAPALRTLNSPVPSTSSSHKSKSSTFVDSGKENLPSKKSNAESAWRPW